MSVSKKGRILFLTRYGYLGASSRYRFFQYFSFFRNEGFACKVSTLFDDVYLTNRYKFRKMKFSDLLRGLWRRLSALFSIHKYDLIVLEKEFIPFFLPLFERYLGIVGIPYIVDFDDAIFHRYDCNGNIIIRHLLGNKIKAVMRNAQCVVAGNEYLADYARKAGAKEVAIIPTVVDMSRYENYRKNGKSVFTVGWIGSPTTSPYLKKIAAALAEVCKEGRARVILIGSGEITIPGVSFEIRDWSEDREIEYLRECDVGIMPLPDESWERGKCGLKLIQYMALGLPVVASPVGVNVDIVDDGINGYLVADIQEWISALCTLRDDPEKRRSMGQIGREKVKEKYSLQVNAPLFSRLFNNVINGDHDRPITENINETVVAGFGEEWKYFDQTSLSEKEKIKVWRDYFKIFPWNALPENGGVGADIGCGSGRWATLVAPRVGQLHVIDPSGDALAVAGKNLKNTKNVIFHRAGVHELPFDDNTLDFAYSLGVLHHVPDTQAAINVIVRKLKAGAPLLLYLYYSLDNRPFWFRMLWKIADIVRNYVARQSFQQRLIISQFVAVAFYLPLANIARLLSFFNKLPASWPLSYYRDKSYYVMQTDAFDRFGTVLEQRYSRQQIQTMLEKSGLSDIVFSDSAPFWCVCGKKK